MRSARVWPNRAALGRAAVLLVLAAARAQAQSDVEVNGQIQFNFSHPGARSLSLGGAFIGLADDATAAYTNPAGLTSLVRPELSAEGRLWQFKHSYTDSGRLQGVPTGFGVDTATALVTGHSTDRTGGPSFVSFVYPLGRLVLAAYRDQAAEFEANVETQGAFLTTGTATSPLPSLRLLPTRSEMKLGVSDYGLSAAYRIGDRLSVGAGVAYYDFTIESLTTRYGFPSLTPGAPGNYYGPASFEDSSINSRQVQEGDGQAFGYTLGLQVKASQKLGLAAVYQHAPAFEYSAENRVGPYPDPRLDGTVAVAKTATFDIPDLFGLGVTFRPTNALTISADYRHLSYTDLLRETVIIILGSNAQPADMKISDASEYHFGLEYIFGRTKTPFALRLGTWRDPEHRMYFGGTVSDPDTLAKTAIFRKGSAAWHGAGGLGVVLNKFQIDAGLDVSSQGTTGSLAMVLRF